MTDPENVYISPAGARRCRACDKSKNQERRRKMRVVPEASLVAAMSETAKGLFFAKVERTSGCWRWTGQQDINGYGRTALAGRPMLAYRVSYLLAGKAIPSGYEVDHCCRRRLCVNPAHLEAVTKHENWRRGDSISAINARKSHCTQGHPYDDDNTIVKPNGWRICRACLTERRRRYIKRKRLQREAGAS